MPDSATIPSLDPVTLTGRWVRLEPLTPERHEPGLLEIALEPELWRWTLDDLRTPADVRDYVERAMAERTAGQALPFATIDLVSGRVAGCTRFFRLDAWNRRVEIGFTWVGRPFQRSHVNTEAKLLMLRHAFGTMGCVRVEFTANALNEPSRRAIERLGAVFEGTLRKHSLRKNGIWRDTVYYSILDSEWPSVEQRLEGFLERRAASSKTP